MTLLLTEDHVRVACEIAKKRQNAALAKKRPSAWGFDEHNALQVHTWGAISELAVSLLLQQKWHDFLENLANGSGRKPVDVGNDIQVRSTDYPRGNLILHDSDADDEKFVFVIVRDLKKPQIVGWILGRDGKSKKYWRDPVGKGRLAYFVPQSDLRPIEELIRA